MINKSTRTVTLALGVLAVLLLAGKMAAAENIRIAYVDVQRALAETEEGKLEYNKLKNYKDKLQNKISTQETNLRKMQETLEAQQSVLTKDAMQKKAQEYYAAVQELQQSYMKHQQELASKEGKVVQELAGKLEAVIAQLGKSEGYTMILNRAGVAWGPGHLDLTDKVIQMYNSKHKVKGKKK